MSEPSRFDFTRILRFLSKEEVKTPLAFFFKVVPYLVAAWIAILYAPITDQLKYTFIVFTSVVLVGLCVGVGLFAWLRPTHLVYGEAGHRAERKWEYGTERKSMDEKALEGLEKVQNPRQLPRGNE
jgi:predicted membrane channel-forming protein YqfA (hemolysin III family)